MFGKQRLCAGEVLLCDVTQAEPTTPLQEIECPNRRLVARTVLDWRENLCKRKRGQDTPWKVAGVDCGDDCRTFLMLLVALHSEGIDDIRVNECFLH